MTMKDMIRNMYLAIIGVLIALFLIEFGLYLSGKFYRLDRAGNNAAGQKESGLVKILCLGDSWTFGLGAEKGHSYPSQLERMLNADNPDSVVVYNGGWPGATSSKVFENLEQDLQKYSPHILIILIGGNDKYLVENNPDLLLFKDDGLKSLIYRLERYLARYRVYKLFKRGLDALFVKAWERRLRTKFKTTDASVLFRSEEGEGEILAAKTRKELKRYIDLAEEHFNQSRLDSAVNGYKKAVALMPDTVDGYLGLGWTYSALGKHRLAADEFEKVLKIDPRNQDALRRLTEMYFWLGEKHAMQETLEKYLYLNPEDIPRFLPFLRYGPFSAEDMESEESLVFEITAFNLKNIIDFARKREIEVIIQNYPTPYDPDSPSLVSGIASEKGVFFADNKAVFLGLEASEGYQYEDYFAQDGHCNGRGYAVIARNIYNIIKDRDLLEVKLPDI